VLASAEGVAVTFTIKQKTCKVCRTAFTPARPMARVCSPICAIEAVKQKNEKTAKAAQVADRRETKAKLDAITTKPDLVKKAQAAFNKFVRARDAGKPCISCGKPLQAATIGGAFDCGHYRSVGSAVHMRFVEDNAHGQCKHCNRHLAGNHVAYRAGLIERIGLHSVEQIERDNTLRKYTHEGLIEIAKHYNAEAKRLIGAA
jgi:hypothetical protein